ncbi:unnamed protein product [Candidula unifasciata]|uniref:Fucosyltransferase n=1 Tax=Candidula unifasciata TaxID=100452 RepID=A0A8S3Z6G5_9EUPU|nr:unnamed protein product [Candidula unifasciata]
MEYLLLFSQNEFQSKVNYTYKRHFLLQENELHLRTFTRPHTSRNNPQSTACDKEVSRTAEQKNKLIVSYNMPHWWIIDFNFSHCECTRCQIVYSQNINQADIVLFDGVRLSIKSPPPRPTGQIWVVVGSEAPIYYTGLLHTPQWRGVFNWTNTHHIDADIFVPYGLLVQRDYSPSSRTYYESLAKSKTKLAVAVISHCQTKSLREEYIKELQQYMAVDVYGFCGTKTACRKKNNTCLSELVQPYTFLLAFENSLCQDYVTEKFFRTFSDDFPVIPVVRGGTDYRSYFPHGTFIDASDFRCPKELAAYLKMIGNDPKNIADMLEAKSR